ncbi:hypothetical protein H634G_11751 [Metarhizium anisopliae BRIP 53293]|uniref:Uncharacterized protein n=1 Tax=Metarhizium anisopliae BRIP 53293 TaxID=1291518 RepID=A0A0D9NHS1_METAN|nr:hypothetical protein H634G_11751 [Metarhizium anisopliae BRIP 53293]
MPPILVLLPSHQHDVDMDVDASNQRLFCRRELRQSGRHGAEVKMIFGREEQMPS